MYKLFTIAQLWVSSYFGVSFSHERRSERIERRFESQNPSQRGVFFQVNFRTQLCMISTFSTALKIREEIV